LGKKKRGGREEKWKIVDLDTGEEAKKARYFEIQVGASEVSLLRPSTVERKGLLTQR